ncbi:MAG: sensor histidine kinase [Solidesulfovibrio sp.]
MTGGRLLVVGGPDADVLILANRLTAPGRACAAFSPKSLLALPPESLPDVAVVSLAGLFGPDPVPQLLRALEGRPVHLVLVADAFFVSPPGQVRLLRGLDADGIDAVLSVLAERDEQARLAKTHASWRNAFFSGFPGTAVACDSEHRVVFGNAPLAHRAGGDPVGMSCFAALHGRPEPCPWCPRGQMEAGQSVFMEIQSPLDGRFFSMACVPLRLPDTAPLLLSLLLDVTDRNMALARLKTLTRDLERRVSERTDTLAHQAEVLAEANSRLLELDALKSGFLATVTHDLRTPLTSVLGFAKLTRREFLKEFMQFSDVSEKLRRKGIRIADNLRIIENEGSRLTRLVNDFLDLSKIESGRLDWNDREIDPAEVMRAAVAAVGGEYEQNEQLALVVNVPEQLPTLWVDPDRLMQVLVNLLTNAARHTGEGEVVLSARHLPSGRVEFRVADTGQGIPEDERERIFDKFYQARHGDTTAPDRRGTGLGLAICKQIVERYGGDIRAEAATPRGTIFVVELPCLKDLPRSGLDTTADRQEAGIAPS